ncbi:RNA-directed RNA polymerase [ssRNA phage SRR6255746_3]|uniref:RNA-directed RNA polymerase n=1 Tax=ssRNA phage SRR6255746_3 TaxID=2786505 RepID=A0A8S5L073_9VIRU|nr:RNA-directed RNA polymerase [ssRNA phage SRR6255746_3]DAD50968.1 TPA_asm: RNA-directed RNA polymerase [ssRNA phage SRR6255746_3]
MDPLKSRFEYLELLVATLSDNPLSLSQKDLQRDIKTIRSRVAQEGLSFLTKTLPKLGKALDAVMAGDTFDLPRGFPRGKGKRPAFLQAYFKRVLGNDGELLDDADVDAIKHIRQVCYMLYKLELPYSAKTEQAVLDGFVRTEQELEIPRNGDSDSIIAAASYIVRDLLEGFNPKEIVCRHGPGAVATGERTNDKWTFKRLYSSIHQYYPYYEYFVAGWAAEVLDRVGWYKSLERLTSGQAKVILVPKDSRGPRLISCEPLEYQWIQQGLGRKLSDYAERRSKYRINFKDQGRNRELALTSSLTREFATLDLKDASDRVSCELVERVFAHTGLVPYLMACRTTSTLLPDGRSINLKKFAPMGSALCFPVEAIIFWAISVAAVNRLHGGATSKSATSVFVYGDDIIVPTDAADAVVAALESCALKVNRAKCCIRGPFRESCGMDAFKGESVTVTKVRTLWTGKRSDGSAFASYIALRNQLKAGGYVQAAAYVATHLGNTYGKIPYGTIFSGFPCFIVDDPVEASIKNARNDLKVRYNENLQRLEWNIRALKSVKVDFTPDGWPRLLRDITMGAGDEPDQVVVPRSTILKRGWAAI